MGVYCMKKKEVKKAIKELDCILKDWNEGVKTIQIAIDVAKDLHGKLIDEVKIKK